MPYPVAAVRGKQTIGGGGAIVVPPEDFDPLDYTRHLHLISGIGLFTDASGTTPVSSDGDLIRRWEDQSGNARHMGVASDGLRPTHKTNIINGHATVRFGGSQAMQDINTTAATWKFLHDGSPYTILFIWKSGKTTLNSTERVISTNVGSVTNAGFNFMLLATNAQLWQVAKAGSPARFQMQSPAYTVNPNVWHVSAMRYDPSLGSEHARMNTDGSFGASLSAAHVGTASSANPASYLRLGEDTAGNFRFNGDIAELVIFDTALSDADYLAAIQYYAAKYPGYEPSLFPYLTSSVVAHETTEPNHVAFPGLCTAANGDLVMAYSKLTGHVTYDDAQLVVITSSDGGATWSAENVIFDTNTDGGGTEAWLVGGLTTLSDGRILIQAGERVVGGTVVANGIGYFESSDNGATWSGPHYITTGFTGWAAEGGGILELASGTLLCPHYGRNTSDVRDSARVSYSTDDGATWADLAYIYNGHTGTFNAQEPGLIQRADGTVCALIRNGTSNVIHQVTSTDDGATWSGTGGLNLGVSMSGRQNPQKLSTGEWVNVIRNLAQSNYAYLMWSPDEGANWQLGCGFIGSPNFTQTNMVYGQLTELEDGTLCIAYGSEGTVAVGDVMFAKAD